MKAHFSISGTGVFQWPVLFQLQPTGCGLSHCLQRIDILLSSLKPHTEEAQQKPIFLFPAREFSSDLFCALKRKRVSLIV